MNRKVISISLLILAGNFLLHAQSATQWRGLDRTGHFPALELMDKWPEEGPELLVHAAELPDSYSSVVVKNGIIYTTGILEEDEILTALKADGTILWNTIYGRAWDKSYRPARCTPSIEGNRAWLISGRGSLACVSLEDGKLLWSVDGYAAFGAEPGNWGTAESPLLVDDLMVYTPCGERTTVVALDKNSGETRWISKSIGDQSAYVSPMLVEREGHKLIITVTGNHVLCLNAADGEIFWKLEYSAIEKPMMGVDINPVTPLVRGNEVFITSGYNHAGVMLRVSEDWRSADVKWISEDLDVHHGGVVEVEGFLYGSNYTSIKKGNWLCLDWNSGELMYEAEWNTKGQIITADGKLICYDERRGNLALVEATPEGFHIKSEFTVTHGNGPHWSHPTIYEGKLYLRHGKSLLAYRIGS